MDSDTYLSRTRGRFKLFGLSTIEKDGRNMKNRIQCWKQSRIGKYLITLLFFLLPLTQIYSQSQSLNSFQIIKSLDEITSLDSSANSKWYLSTEEINPTEFTTKYFDYGTNSNPWIEYKIPSNYNKIEQGKPEIHRIWLMKSILLPENFSANSISVRLGTVSDRDKTYFNGVLIGETGEFGSSQPRAYDKVRIYEIPSSLIRKGKENLILIQAEEYFEGYIGIDQDKTEIGPTKIMEKHFYGDEYIKLLLLMVYITVGFYFLFLYLRRQKERENLLFAAFTILLVAYQFLRNQIKYDIGIDFVYLKKIEYLILNILIPIFAHFIRVYFKYKWNSVLKAMDFIILASFLYVLFVLNVRHYDFINTMIVQPIWVIYIGMLIYYLINQIREKNIDAIFILAGAIIVIAASIVDMLSSRGILVTPRVVGYAFIFFILSLAIILANRFVRLNEEVEELNESLERKVAVRTEELSQSLADVKKIKMSQDGDYFLTSLLIKPLGRNHADKNQVLIDFIVKQKKTFEFKNKVSDLGGDLCRAESLTLCNRDMTVFFNADAMGKSMQGAGGALVTGSVFDSILERTRLSKTVQEEYPEKWLKDSFIELHKVFESFQGSMLVSIVMGLIDNQTGLMYFINAEHPVSVLYRDGKASFIDEDFIFRKLGTEITQSYIHVKTFQMKDGDIIVNGSDGRDDILILDEKTGEKKLNYDQNLFLGTVEKSAGDINKIVDLLYKTGEITDDLSLLSIQFTGKEPLTQREADRNRIKTLIQVKEYQQAIVVAEDYLNLNPSDTESIFLISYAYKKLQKFKEAIKFGERVRLREPEHIRNLVNLAHCYFRLKNIQRAKYLAGLIPDGGREKAFTKIFLLED